MKKFMEDKRCKIVYKISALLMIWLAALCLNACSSGSGSESIPSSERSDEKLSQTPSFCDETMTEKNAAVSSEETEAAIDSEETEGTDLHQASDEILSRIGWEPGQMDRLEEIQTLLDEQGVRYTGYFNATQERLDMELEDGTKLMFLSASDDMGQNQRYQLMMAGDERFDSNGFQEDYLHQYDVTFSEYFYPDTEKRLLTQEDLWSKSLNLTDLSIARNEIYARHGRIFQDAFLNAVFRTKDWYQPLYSADEFEQKAEPFSETELANIQTISEYEDYLKHVSIIDGKKLSAQRILLSGSWLDLDGDGEKEQITYQFSVNSDNDFGEYSLQAGDSVKKGEGINLYRYVDVIFLNDRTTLLSVGSNGPSDDPSGDYYLYQKQSLILLGQLGGELIGSQGDCLYTKGQWDFFQTFQRTRCFELDNGLFKSRSTGNYHYGNRATAIRNVPLYKDEEFSEIGLTLQPGDEVIIVESDLESAVLIKQESTGKSGWLRCKEAYTCILPDGSEWNSWELFDGLVFYG